MEKYYVVYLDGSYQEAASLDEAKEIASQCKDEYNHPDYIAVIDVDKLRELCWETGYEAEPEDAIYAAEDEVVRRIYIKN